MQKASKGWAEEESSPGEGVTTILGGAGFVEGTSASYDAYRPRPVEINTANTPRTQLLQATYSCLITPTENSNIQCVKSKTVTPPTSKGNKIMIYQCNIQNLGPTCFTLEKKEKKKKKKLQMQNQTLTK